MTDILLDENMTHIENNGKVEETTETLQQSKYTSTDTMEAMCKYFEKRTDECLKNSIDSNNALLTKLLEYSDRSGNSAFKRRLLKIKTELGIKDSPKYYIYNKYNNAYTAQ